MRFYLFPKPKIIKKYIQICICILIYKKNNRQARSRCLRGAWEEHGRAWGEPGKQLCYMFCVLFWVFFFLFFCVFLRLFASFCVFFRIQPDEYFDIISKGKSIWYVFKIRILTKIKKTNEFFFVFFAFFCTLA